ncbi:hypothetical protein F4818DRAFT_80555 [Hypoxylon cercidicola]|nr:hypothetical protein F4818DRAFT_80555 [Hypoxylon cercidicola]
MREGRTARVWPSVALLPHALGLQTEWPAPGNPDSSGLERYSSQSHVDKDLAQYCDTNSHCMHTASCWYLALTVLDIPLPLVHSFWIAHSWAPCNPLPPNNKSKTQRRRPKKRRTHYMDKVNFTLKRQTNLQPTYLPDNQRGPGTGLYSYLGLLVNDSGPRQHTGKMQQAHVLTYTSPFTAHVRQERQGGGLSKQPVHGGFVSTILDLFWVSSMQ